MEEILCPLLLDRYLKAYLQKSSGFSLCSKLINGSRRATTAEQRKDKLRKLKSAVEAHGDEIVAAVKQDTRKPEGEISVTELLNVTANIERNINNLDDWMKPVEVAPSQNKNDKAKIVYEARGVCLILGPWNFPLGLVMGPLAAAIAAGNCCIVKLTDLCPATARVAAKIIREAFEENEVALFEGGVDVATALLELPFNHIFFTGSTRVGKLVMAAAAKHLATVTLELGGKSPVIVDEDADVKKIGGGSGGSQAIQWGAGLHLPRLCVHQGAAEGRPGRGVSSQGKAEPVPRTTGASRRKVSPRSSMIRISAASRNCSMMRWPRAPRLPLAALWRQADRTIHPTMLTDVTPDMLIMQEEIFGPVVPVLTYKNIDDVIDYISGRAKPLALYIYSNDQNNIDKVLSRTSSGGVTINGFFSHYLENQLPFGGVNQSGMGSYHGVFGFKAFSHERAIYIQENR